VGTINNFMSTSGKYNCSTGQSPQWAILPMEEEVVNIVTTVLYTRLVSRYENR